MNLQLFMFVFRLGILSFLLSECLVSGFTTAAAIHVFTSQVKDLLGLKLPRISGNFEVIKVRSISNMCDVFSHSHFLDLHRNFHLDKHSKPNRHYLIGHHHCNSCVQQRISQTSSRKANKHSNTHRADYHCRWNFAFKIHEDARSMGNHSSWRHSRWFSTSCCAKF